MKKKEVIENLYSTFSKYTTSDMHYCDCGCIDINDVKKLASKKLRDLEEDDLSSYQGSALYTWGEIKHYKHFLPRILEVYNILYGKGLIDMFDITYKLNYAKWTTWNVDEINAIKDFVQVDWIEFVNERASEIKKEDLEYYSFFFEITELLQMWKFNKQENGLRNFVYFFYYYGTELMNKGIKLKDKIYQKEFKDLVNRNNLIEQLETFFFGMIESDNDYAEKISVVIQMIEQEKRNIG